VQLINDSLNDIVEIDEAAREKAREMANKFERLFYDRRIKLSSECKTSPERDYRYHKLIVDDDPRGIMKRFREESEDGSDDGNFEDDEDEDVGRNPYIGVFLKKLL
jgi:hypothetical protein